MAYRIIAKGLVAATIALLIISCVTIEDTQLAKQSASLASNQDEVSISIVSLNDLHGGGLSVNKKFEVGQSGNRQAVAIGGPAAIKTYFESIKRNNPEGVLILDAGDSYQGSLVSNNSRGQAVASLYNFIGVDASTIGNHEFDWGGILASTEAQQSDYDSPFLRIVEKSNHPFLAHNMSFQGQALEYARDFKDSNGVAYNIMDSTGKPKLASYAMFMRNGVKIAVIGGITKTAMQSSSPAHYRGVDIKGIGEGLVELVQSLRSNQGAQLVVLLVHAGASCDFTNFDYLSDQKNTSAQCPGDAQSDEIREVFAQITAQGYQPQDLIDVVVAGHVHAPQAHYYSGVPVIQNADKGLGFGRVDIRFRHSDNAVVARKIFPPELFCHQHFQNYPDCNPNGPAVNLPYPPTLGEKIPPVYAGEPLDIQANSSDAKAALAEFDALFREKNKQITHLEYPLVHDRFKESIMDRCYVDAIKVSANADLVISISGGIRESLPQGAVTAGDVFEVAPFDGGAVEVSMTGKELKAYIAMDNKDFSPKSMPIVSGGWKLKVSCAAPRQEVKPLEIFEFDDKAQQWKQPDDEKVYTVVVSSYLFENDFFAKYRANHSRVIQSERDLLTTALSGDEQPQTCGSPAGARPNTPEIKRCDDSHVGSRWCGISAECPL